MHTSITTLVLLALTIVTVNATIHTKCFNHFMQQDKCVHSAAGDDLRCKEKPQQHPAPVAKFDLKVQTKVEAKVQIPSRLQRRYDDNTPSFTISSGDGICGSYDSDKELGVCLWSGPEQDNPTVESAGWLNGLKTSNCGKQVYVQRLNDTEGTNVHYVPVLDGCGFNTKKVKVGCFEIGLTTALFHALNPTQQEKDDEVIHGGITWDWNNPRGDKPTNGPV